MPYNMFSNKNTRFSVLLPPLVPKQYQATLIQWDTTRGRKPNAKI